MMNVSTVCQETNITGDGRKPVPQLRKNFRGPLGDALAPFVWCLRFTRGAGPFAFIKMRCAHVAFVSQCFMWMN